MSIPIQKGSKRFFFCPNTYSNTTHFNIHEDKRQKMWINVQLVTYNEQKTWKIGKIKNILGGNTSPVRVQGKISMLQGPGLRSSTPQPHKCQEERNILN